MWLCLIFFKYFFISELPMVYMKKNLGFYPFILLSNRLFNFYFILFPVWAVCISIWTIKTVCIVVVIIIIEIHHFHIFFVNHFSRFLFVHTLCMYVCMYKTCFKGIFFLNFILFFFYFGLSFLLWLAVCSIRLRALLAFLLLFHRRFDIYDTHCLCNIVYI